MIGRVSPLVVKPSELFTEFDLGEIFESCGKRYILLARDPWQVKIARYTKFDEKLASFVDWLLRRK